MHLAEWKSLPLSIHQLSIPTVLRCGQSFRWKNTGENKDLWSCALSGRIIHLKQDPSHLHYRATFPAHRSPPVPDKDDTLDLIKDYFSLNVDLVKLYAKWAARDQVFARQANTFSGVRILKQDPWENLLSFICSANNNISRISQMVDNLCVHWGEKLGEVEGIEYFDFPRPEKLADEGTESRLREMGFGYRAKYVARTARVIAEDKGLEWFHQLRKMPYKEVHAELMQLSGVGPKVADCVCLMSLDKMEAVPVDTHILTIAQRDYKIKVAMGKSMTLKVYNQVGDFFRELWGEEAGWAHSVLFAGELKAFSERRIQASMEFKRKVREEGGEVKAEEKEVKKEVVEENEVKLQEGEGGPEGGNVGGSSTMATTVTSVRRSKRLKAESE